MKNEIVVTSGYSALRKDNHSIALSHENCDWMKPICEDNICNAMVLSSKDSFREMVKLMEKKTHHKYEIRHITISVKIDD